MECDRNIKIGDWVTLKKERKVYSGYYSGKMKVIKIQENNNFYFFNVKVKRADGIERWYAVMYLDYYNRKQKIINILKELENE